MRKRIKTEPTQVVVNYDRGDDSKDKGTRMVLKSKMPKKESMSEMFRAVLDQPQGYYTATRFSYLRQGTIDQWGVTTTGANGNPLEFFTPRKFKDAQAISFNAKVPTSSGYTTTTLAANGTETLAPCFIKYSHVRIMLTNITQRRTTVEMYVCYGKNGEGSTNPVTDLDTSYDQYSGTSATMTAKTPYVDPMQNKEWLAMWDVKKIVFKLEQGEHQSYLVKGPKDYVMDVHKHVLLGTNEVTDPVTYNNPNSQGNGCYVWFRMLNDMCLVGNNDAGSATTTLMGNRKIGVHHPINPIPGADGAQQGCVVVRMSEYFHVYANSSYGGPNSRSHLNDYHVIAGATYTETNIDTDQAFTVPATYL